MSSRRCRRRCERSRWRRRMSGCRCSCRCVSSRRRRRRRVSGRRSRCRRVSRCRRRRRRVSRRWCRRRREGRRRCGRRRWRERRCVFDGQHRRTGALARVEPFRGWAGGLIPQYQPAEVAGGVVQPRLHIGNHLRRTPHILSNGTNRLACTHRGGKVAALRRPKSGVVETVPPRGIVRGSRRSAAFLSRCVRGSFPPVGKQLVQFGGARCAVNRPGHIHAQARGYDR